MTPPDSGAGLGESLTIHEVWYMDNNGKLKVEPIATGITDGKNTEIVKSRNLEAGTKIITGILEESSETSSNTTTNALTGQSSNRRGMGGPGGPPPF